MSVEASSEILSTPFLRKLYSILNDSVFNSVITWTNDGSAFWVRDVPEFSESILPKYFKHNNFSSFVRQLSNYGFQKRKENRPIFHHPLFIKDRVDLLKQMTTKRDQGISLALCQKLAKSELGPAI